jgi:cytoskeletal protein CcmA (bactofilin family)
LSDRRLPPLGAVLGPDAHHQGDLTFEGRVRIDGRFTGRLYSEGMLELGASGVVEGEVDVANAVISGRVSGSLRVRERLRLEPTAVIEGKLDAAALDLQPGATIRGEVRVCGG